MGSGHGCRIVGVLVLAALVMSGCSDGAADTPAEGDQPPSTVEMVEADAGGSRLSVRSPQPLESSTIVVDEAELASAGYLVVYADGQGAPGAQAGVSALLAEGVNEDVEIALNSLAAGSEQVWVMVHAESSGDQRFDAASDPPVSGDDGVLVVSIEVDS